MEDNMWGRGRRRKYDVCIKKERKIANGRKLRGEEAEVMEDLVGTRCRFIIQRWRKEKRIVI
jgi:hypothetical protein